jgi:hypothetical protein
MTMPRLAVRYALLALFLLAAPMVALAECVHEGQTYPEGTRLGPYICQDGEWVPA